MQQQQQQTDNQFRTQEMGMKQGEANFNQSARRSEMTRAGFQPPVQPVQPVELPPDPMTVIAQGFAQLMQALQILSTRQDQLGQVMAAPIEVVRGPDGRIAGAQKVLPQPIPILASAGNAGIN